MALKWEYNKLVAQVYETPVEKHNLIKVRWHLSMLKLSQTLMASFLEYFVWISKFCYFTDQVHQRMVKLGNVRGKSITLKVMVRAEDASTETAKFLGHGICDSFSRSSNLSFFTNDSEVILREVTLLLRQLKGEL